MAWTFLGLLIIVPFWLVAQLYDAHRTKKMDEWMERRFELERRFREEGLSPLQADDKAWRQTTEELGPWGQFFGLDE